MEEIKKQYRPHKKRGIILGIILIVFGALLLLFNFGLLEKGIRSVILSWQTLVIIFAVLLLLYRHFFSGITILILGLFFLIPKLVAACPDTFGWLGDNFIETYWPALLIVTGILVIVRLFFPKLRKNNYASSRYYRKKKQCGCGDNCNCNNGFDRNTVFGSVEEIILDPVFNGGDVNSVFGNVVLDLRKTTIPEGDTELEINCVFGSITLFIPDNWNISLNMDKFAGGLEDKRQIANEVDYPRRLIINGAIVFGYGEIRS
jgi:predicted membrane protein